MRRRIVILYLVLAVIVSTLVAFVTYRYSTKMYISEIETGLKNEVILVNRIISGDVREEITDATLKEISDILISKNDLHANSSRRITLIDRTGKVLADSSGNSENMENHLDRIEVLTALKGEVGIDIRKSETTGLDLIYLAQFSDELNAVLRISASVRHINDIRNTILFYAVAAVIAGMVISSLIALKLSGYVVRPIARLVKEYGGALGYDSKKNTDEVRQLSSTLRSMTKYIEDIIKELQERNDRVNAIINSMDNGIIAVDTSMHIIMINPIAKKVFGVKDNPDIIGVPLIQIIHNRQINDLLLKAIVSNKVVNGEIILYQKGKRLISVHVSPVYPMDNQTVNSGALAFLNDITQVRKLEEMRSEFVANVTHELKTPLTSIQGFVETLKSGAVKNPDVAEKFLDIIEIEADRLHDLINDILQLSEIEGMKQDKETQLFELYTLVEEVGSMLENVAVEKGISIENKVDPGITVRAGRYRIKQLLINLMDNAVKYNKPGGRVSVWAEQRENNIEIHVKDTGIGIPPDYTARIFERFYRVDRSRSREMGGTGLGLSIVKHIAQLYGGAVRVESEEAEGSDFIVSLPSARQ